MLLALVKEALARKRGQEPGHFAPGLPSKDVKRPIPSVKEPKDWEFSEQIHDVRAGRHSDLRLSDGKTAFSWALRKGLPTKPGEKRLAIRQSDHSPQFLTFSGKISSGYGKGKVRLNRFGDVRILFASKNKIRFATLDTKNPQEYTMIRTPKMGKDRWLVLKTTPTTKSHPGVPTTKERFREASLEDIGRFMTKKWLLASKIDGAGVTVDVGKRGIEVFSQNPSKKGDDLISHSHILDLGTPSKNLHGTQMRAEIFGKKGKKIIPLRQLAGLMNSSPGKARREMKSRGIKLMLAPWKMLKFRGEKVDDIPYDDQIDLMKSVSRDLPGKFVLPSIAKTPAAKARLIQKIREGKHHLTSEGMVAWPTGGVDARPFKIPFKKHTQVYIREVYRLKVMGKEVDLAGGFSYSLTPRGHIVGNVGTGFTAKQRKEYWKDRKILVGKKALIHSKGQFPSGAYRAPAFISIHLS